MSMEVAQTILKQLGGNKFLAMTGAKNLTGDVDSLTFKLPGGVHTVTGPKRPITHVRVTLLPTDTYRMSYLNCRRTKTSIKQEVVATDDGVYNDMLQRCFTATTGLDTRL